MKSKVEVNLNGLNYLKKGERPTVVIKEGRYTILETMRKQIDSKGAVVNKMNTFKVSNELMGLWFKECE